MSIPPLPDRTVVFIGRTGSGKSTCANALAGQTDLFKESDGSVSETKNIDAKLVPLIWQTHQYTVKIVDTIGIGDTNLPPDEVLATNARRESTRSISLQEVASQTKKPMPLISCGKFYSGQKFLITPPLYERGFGISGIPK